VIWPTVTAGPLRRLLNHGVRWLKDSPYLIGVAPF